MTSLGELRDALTALGLSTSTGSLRGDERRTALEQRLHDARIKLGLVVDEPEMDRPRDAGGATSSDRVDVDAYRSVTLSHLRTELETRKLSTQTPGLKGEARRHALIQRLQNAARSTFTCAPTKSMPEQPAIIDIEPLKSSRSSTSSYSAASEFLFFDSARHESIQIDPLYEVPHLHLTAASSVSETKDAHLSNHTSTVALSPSLRTQLEQEVVDTRKQLHEIRARRSQETGRRLQDAGFDQNLDKLSAAMAQLEAERQRLLRVAFGHELIRTVTQSGQHVELIQEDAVQLIEKQQALLRQHIHCVKYASKLACDEHGNQENVEHEARLEQSIRRIERQLREQHAVADTSRSSIASSSLPSASDTEAEPPSLPVLTRCRSVPTHMFHDTWQTLDDTQRQQLQHELRAHKSFRMRRDRVCVNTTLATERSAPPFGRPSVAVFHRYPPTTADKLGIQALFLEQSQRSVREIVRVYDSALQAEPDHALVLGNYARFLRERCKDPARAQLMYERAMRAEPRSAFHVAAYASYLHHTRHAYDEAERLYAQALELEPNDPSLLGNYASLLLRTRANGSVSQLVEAKTLLVRALEIDHDHVANRLRLCRVLEALGDTAGALRVYEQLMEAAGATGNEALGGNLDSERLTPRSAVALVQRAHVYGNFANFLTRSGDWDRAKRMYETALRLTPDDVLLQRNFSLLLRRYKRTPGLST